MKFSYIMKAAGISMLIASPLLSTLASPLTPDEALRRIQGSSTMSRVPGKTLSFELVHTEDVEGNAMLFVFNRGDNGFVIASADDDLPPVLGYSDNGSFSLADASPELKWWLGQYAGEASYYLLHRSEFTSAAAVAKPARVDRANIPELLTTRWNQDDPYNLYCPQDAGGRSVTGCVATAMAQVIRYHAYPVQGFGQHSYLWNGQTLSFDYGSTTFNYPEMLDYYDGNATPAQREAVATLMYACGVSVNMSYSSAESGAGDMYIPHALKTYFNYDNATRLLKRSCFTTEEWEDIVYGELAANRPVIYGGQAPDGGHEFVCDGYENGYYHINWGWAGMGNGYFLLSALDPGLQGIGGFSGGYNSEQAIVCGAQPGKGDGFAWYPIYATGNMAVTEVAADNSQALVVFKNGGLYNYSPEGANLSFYLKVVSESGIEYLADTPLDLEFPGASGLNVSGYSGIPLMIPSGLEAGTYKAYLVFKTPEGQWQDVLFPLSLPTYLNLTVGDDGKCEFSEGVPVLKTKIKVTAFAPATTVISGVPTRFDLTVENIGEIEFSNAISVKVFEKGVRDEALAENRIRLSLAPGEVFTGYLSLTYTLADGEYDAVVFDQYGDEVSDVFTFRIGEAPVEVSRIVLDVSDTSMETDATLQLNAAVLPDDASDKSLVWSSSDPEIANVDQTGLVTAFAPGKVIITVTSASNEEISASCQITVKEKVIEAAGVTLDKTEATLTEGETLTLTATVDPEETTDKTLTWTSSDEEVATVENGIVTALKPGNVTITVSTSNGKTAKCEITVKAKVIEAAGVTLDKSEATLTEGETLTLTATVDPEETTDKTLTWTSSDEEVATVENGVVTALKPGTVTITVSTSNGRTAKCEITVEAKVIEATGVTLDKTEATLTEGETLTLTATVDPEETTDKTLTWTSSDEEVATVENGIVTALKPGTVTITVSTSNGKTAKCEITVVAKVIYVSSVTLDKTEIEAVTGDEFTLVATVLPEDATDKTLLWSSSDEAIASVDQTGKVTINGIGSAVITAHTTDGSEIKAECRIFGTSLVDAIENGGLKVDVYTVNGMLIKSDAGSRTISDLVKGTYIIRVGEKAHKIVK